MRLRNKYYIVVSGSNGKTTTTYLITNMLNTQFSAISCGNCGFPISQAALDYRHYKYYVIELSSFQLKGIKKFTPKIAVVTNVKQAHLDYHKSIEDYYKSKINITKNQTKEDYLVLNIDDPTSVLLFKSIGFSLNVISVPSNFTTKSVCAKTGLEINSTVIANNTIHFFIRPVPFIVNLYYFTT